MRQSWTERAAHPGSEGSVPSPRIRPPCRDQAAFETSRHIAPLRPRLHGSRNILKGGAEGNANAVERQYSKHGRTVPTRIIADFKEEIAHRVKLNTFNSVVTLISILQPFLRNQTVPVTPPFYDTFCKPLILAFCMVYQNHLEFPISLFNLI